MFRIRRLRALVPIFVVAIGLVMPAPAAMAAPAMTPGTRGPVIWTGYVKEWRGADPYTGYYSVHAEWLVPKVECPPRPEARQYRVSMWVGLGGWNGNNPFAQAGIGIYCMVNPDNGMMEPTYNAWREYISGVYGAMKPPEELPLNWPTDRFPVRPRDKIIADVVYENGQSLVRLVNVDPNNGMLRWETPAEERKQIPRFVSRRFGVIPVPVPIPTNGVSAEVIVEAGHPTPIFDHIVFRNTNASRSPSFGYIPRRWLPFPFFRPDPYGSWDEATGQVHYPTDFNTDNEFAVFQTFSKYNPFPPPSYPADISGIGPARP